MTMRAAIRHLFCAALLAGAAGSLLAAPIEKSLLTPDGTLYAVQAGRAADLGVAGGNILPSDFIIEWSARRQDGSVEVGIIPGTANANAKRDLDLTFEEGSGALVLLWSEYFSYLNQIHLAILRSGNWETVALAPNLGMPRAFNPRMLLSHHSARYEVEGGREVTANRPLLSIIWWEEASRAQARYAPIFLDEDLNAQELKVYDLPVLVGQDAPAAATAPLRSHMFPSLQSEGLGGSLLATFADLGRQKQYVVKITFPDNLGRPGSGNLTWQRRRIPVVGVMLDSPLAPIPEMNDLSVGTVIGAGYKPTQYWQDRDTVRYIRFDGRIWAATRSIVLGEQMSYERAVRLIEEMARRN
ncbi:MAG: hypothetical protein H7X85_02485 [Thermoanaerobaculia bacterium]|nr:hypothetical protein [Thermoanaerobaculia bacterium]